MWLPQNSSMLMKYAGAYVSKLYAILYFSAVTWISLIEYRYAFSILIVWF